MDSAQTASGSGHEAGQPGDLEVSVARTADVAGMSVRRLLPLRRMRSVGAWCFIDHYGPVSVDGQIGMAVPPHPHIGLQTVTWLLAGNVLHRDSLGSEQMIRPGQLNLMTAGRGIAHAEESPAEHDPELHGVQLWVALPDASRMTEPAFEHHADLPRTRFGGFDATVLIGTMAGTEAEHAVSSPARTFSDLVGAQLTASRDIRTELPLEPRFEHVLFAVTGSALAARPSGLGHADLRPARMLYLPAGRDRVPVSAAAGTVLLLLGGVPLGEPLLMWWNFVARTREEIEAAAADWAADKFESVGGYDGPALAAPPVTGLRLKP